MLAVLLLALIAIALFGVGFAVHVLWWVAIAAAIVWLLGFVVRPSGGARRARWYYW